jgi:hypothetical protein
MGYDKDVDFDIEYRGKTFHIIGVEVTYNRFYLVTKLTDDNVELYDDIAYKARRDKSEYKESYKGLSGLVPLECWDRVHNIGMFDVDMWMPDENKERYGIH